MDIDSRNNAVEAPGLHVEQGVVYAEPVPSAGQNHFAMPAQKVIAEPLHYQGPDERTGIVGAFENAADYTGQMATAAGTNIEAGTKAVVYGTGNVARDAANFTYADRVLNPVGNVAGDAQKAVSKAAGEGFDYVVDGGLADDTGNLFTSIGEGIADGAKFVGSGIVDAANEVGNMSADAARFTHINVVTDPIGNGAAYAQRGISSGISDGASAVAEFVGFKDASETQVAQFRESHAAQREQENIGKTYALNDEESIVATRLG